MSYADKTITCRDCGMDFVFTAFEVGVVFMATLIVALISLDGRTNWLEGVQLLGAYFIVGAGAFFMGSLE